MQQKMSRSAIMRSIPSHATTPERLVRKVVRALGFRPSYNQKSLPGSPDIVLTNRRKLIFVHGCFWHGHSCRRGARSPKTNVSYWQEKIGKNKLRDRKNRRRLVELGWESLVVWECQLRAPLRVEKRIQAFLGDDISK